ncbi:hypothetical protein Q7P37_007518 [Cladosporium fusiforme]
MPFPRFSKPKSQPKTDTQPLLDAAATPPTPSIATTITKTKPAPEPYRDVTNTSTSQNSRTNPPSKEEDEEEEQTPSETPPFPRPKTPPQGTNHTAWSSYRTLPPSHPVFRYPDDVREKMYDKGIDPVVKAEMDLARLGRVYGEKHSVKGFWKRGTSMMGLFGSMAVGGAF